MESNFKSTQSKRLLLGRHKTNTGPSHTATRRGLTGRRAAARKAFSPRPTAQASEPEAEGAARGSIPLSQASRKSFSSSVVSSFTCRTSFSASSLLGEAEADGSALWYRAAMAPAPPGPSARGRGEAWQREDPRRHRGSGPAAPGTDGRQGRAGRGGAGHGRAAAPRCTAQTPMAASPRRVAAGGGRGGARPWAVARPRQRRVLPQRCAPRGLALALGSD